MAHAPWECTNSALRLRNNQNLSLLYETSKNTVLFSVFLTFVFYSIFGWILDSSYRSLTERAWKRGGFSPLPFAPSYGIAAVILFALSTLISAYPLFFQWIMLGIFFGAYEYFCGRIATLLLKRRLWDYSQNKFNIQGHTDLLHSMYWGTLAVFTLHWLHPWLMSLFAGFAVS